MTTPKFLLVGDCPAPYDVAPYIHLVLKRAGEEPSSIYRGQDPAAGPLLRRFGKHTQKQLVDASPARRRAWGVTGIPNPYDRSQHELRDSDGDPIPTWKVGVDAGPNTNDNRTRLKMAAHYYGLTIDFPYDSVVEYHHFQFVKQPKPNRKLTVTRVKITRAMLRARTTRLMRGRWG
jgi:hypothetical protein